MTFPTPRPRQDVISSSEPISAHLVGCAGSGMRGLAELLRSWGYAVSGSDAQPLPPRLKRLADSGLRFCSEHAVENLPAETDVVVRSLAIPDSNVELVEARRRGIPVLTYSQMVGQLMQARTGVAVAGTHGKSTTTALTGWLLRESRRSAAALFGANLQSSGASSWPGSGELFVVESCEFQQSFLDFHPRFGVILNVEPDHFDTYLNDDQLIDAFAKFASQIDPRGFLLVRHEDLRARRAAESSRAPITTFGWTPEADWWVSDVRRMAWGFRCRVFHHGQYVSELQVPLIGSHNALNALAACVLAYELGLSPREIRERIQDFPGLQRRFECCGSWRGVTLIDDYAHHPTAVAAVLQGAREQFGRRRLVIAFQPHQVSRTQALLTDFAESLLAADEVLIAPVYAAREQVTDEPRMVSEQLAQEIRQRSRKARACLSLDHVQQVLDDTLNPGDVLVTIGAGDINQVQHAFIRRICRDSAARRTAGPPDVDEGRGTRAILAFSA